MVNRHYNINKTINNNKSVFNPLKKTCSATSNNMSSSSVTKNSVSSSNLDTISEENQYLSDRNRYFNGSEYSHNNNNNNNNNSNDNDSGSNDLNSEYNHDLAINSIGRFQYILQMDRDMGVHNTSYRIPQNHLISPKIDNQSTSSSLSDHSTNTNKYFQFWRKNSKSHIINGSDNDVQRSHQHASSNYYKTQKLYNFICRYIKWPLIFLLAFGILGLIIYFSIFLSNNNSNSDNSNYNYSVNNIHTNDELIFIEQTTKLYDYNQHNYVESLDDERNVNRVPAFIEDTTINGHAVNYENNDRNHLENTPQNTIPTTYNTRMSATQNFNIETTTIEYQPNTDNYQVDDNNDDNDDGDVIALDANNNDGDDDDDAKLTTTNNDNNININTYNHDDHEEDEDESGGTVVTFNGEKLENEVTLKILTTTTTSSTTHNPLKDSFYIFGFTSGHQNNFGVPIEEDERILALINNKTQHISTTDSSIYRTRVSPTLPIIERDEMTTQKIQRYNHSDNDVCQSTSMPLCRGILHYDLTIPNPDYPELSKTDYQHFEHLIASQCSLRVAQFVCAVLEPECRPSKMGTLKPCKRICKSVLEPCAHIIASSEILTTTFDCDSYPNSDEPAVCEDPTRRAKCYGNEYKCGDKSCIPIQWKCDNIKDCPGGEDEENCKFCENDEFKCPTNDKCIPDKWRCDYYVDCPDAADEYDCDDYDDDGKKIYNDYSARSYPIVHEQLPNKPHLRPYLTISGEDRLYSSENRKLTISDDRDETEINDGDPIYLVGSKHIETIVKPNITDITTEENIIGITAVNGSSSTAKGRNGTQDFSNFQDSKEIMMTSDSESDYKYTSSTAQSTSMAHTSPCPENELRCLNGLCITVKQLCDKITDCPDGADEAMCVYDN